MAILRDTPGTRILCDTLSCTGLAVVGAACLATTANPLTLAAVAGPVAAGAAGNLAHGIWTQLGRAGAAKALRAWRGIDENHVVVQALRQSHLAALGSVLKTFRYRIQHRQDA